VARKFVTQREIDFISAINKEFIQRTVGEVVHYYAISIPETRVNDIYNEAIRKTWAPPVHSNALVLWDNPTVQSTQAGPDSEYTLEVYFHTDELRERNLQPREGDFVEYGEVFFEISAVTYPQLVFGQVNNRIMTKCTCVKAREGQFAAGGDSSRMTKNTHPVTNSSCCPECGVGNCS
jgi:hypothetical protein